MRATVTHFIIVDNALRNSFIQHFLIPLLQTFGLGDLLVYRVAMEDIIIPFTGWTRPDVTCCVPGGGTYKIVFIIKTFPLQIKHMESSG